MLTITKNAIERYAYGIKKDIIHKSEEIKCNNIKNKTKNDYFHYVTIENIK